MVVVAAMIKVLEDKGDEFEKAAGKLVPQVLKDPGAITYIIHRSISDPSRFFVYEKYESQEAFQYHSSTPHFQEFTRTILPMLDGSPDIGLYREIA